MMSIYCSSLTTYSRINELLTVYDTDDKTLISALCAHAPLINMMTWSNLLMPTRHLIIAWCGVDAQNS